MTTKKSPLSDLAARQKAKHKAERKAKPAKHKSILEMIAEDMADKDIVPYAESLHYDYKSLWAVRKGFRKLPLEPTLILCQRFGISSEDSVNIFMGQKLAPKEEEAPKKKKHSLLDPYPYKD
jgi:hypothetical protein